MKKYAFQFVFLFICLGLSAQDFKQLIAEGSHTIEEIVLVAENHFDSVGRERGTGYKPFRRWQYFAERAMDETGKLKSSEFYYNELNNLNADRNSEGFTAKTLVGTWEEMGPTYWNATSGYNPGVGRITSISIDHTNLDHIIAGSETGGVWKSLDGGATWTVLTDNLANIDVRSLAIDPNNSNYYFWGSTNGSIFKSSDGGSTWSLHSNVSGGSVNKILIHPTDAQIMYCTSQGNGIYKSTDGGLNWSSIYFAGVSGGYDVDFKPGDPSIVYASGDEFYRSSNNGVSFVKISGVAPDEFSYGPKMIAVSPNDASVVYVLEANSGVFGALYKSIDSGSSFTKLTHTANYFGYDTNGSDDLGQAPRDMDIAVNPNDANDVHIAGINTWRSTDGGISFNITSQWTPNGASNLNIGYCHADVDILEFVGSGAETKLFVGTDGGIYKADNPTTVDSNYYTDLTVGMGIRQFYKIGVSQTNPVVVTGGSQDNGSSALLPDGNWIDWFGADGMEGFVDKNNSNIFYGTAQFGTLLNYSYSALSNSISYLTQPDNKGGDYTWNWIVPFEQDPITPNTIYCAFDEVYKSIDGGFNWESISQSFSNNIDHLKIAPTDNNKIYLAINGVLWYTLNAGISWTQSSLNLGGAQINSIAVHPTDANKIAIATTNSEKVYVSTDNGVTFTGIGWDLPNFSAQALAWQNNGEDGLYLGMNYGVYYTDNTLGNTWSLFNNGLPNVRINELEINAADNKIYAATYGRGLWRSSLYNESLTDSEFKIDEFKMYPNPATHQVNLKWKISEPVTVRVFNALGKLVFYSKNKDLSSTYKIDSSSFASGIYFVKLNSSKGELIKKLIIN
ncbi:T9SS type A sorting domain-containing protein [Winogradskyella endarachnes]|uniref:T9SS type A sorting domain-containing protein n=1 Tax=Winogradskyella endarachnes TaxID=2681965 RepID=A0A6L6UA80_9FLAO|nr:T9SS type A sorting domain-containing protein [Winogradskyella endarachnes]MUU77704.1 T9SS type A sorting domain-containing protein [Winogradskyella endarachnes]